MHIYSDGLTGLELLSACIANGEGAIPIFTNIMKTDLPEIELSEQIAIKLGVRDTSLYSFE